MEFTGTSNHRCSNYRAFIEVSHRVNDDLIHVSHRYQLKESISN